MNRTSRTSTLSITRRLIVVATLSGISLAGLVAAPTAGAIPPGPGDLCGDVVNGCPTPPEPIDDFTAGDPVDPPVEPPVDENPDGGDSGGASVDGNDTLPPAPVGDIVVANPTFTG